MHIHRHVANNSGFTLLEMIIVMAVFTVIIGITGKAFEAIVKQTNIVAKSEETYIEGAIGLDMFRRDLEQTGFGLYTDIDPAPPSFSEASGSPANNYNDTANGIPRAIAAGNNLTPGDSIVLTGTDYLVIKATTVARNKASQNWTYINGSNPGTSHVWGMNDFTTSDYVIAVKQVYKNSAMTRKLIYNTANFATSYNTSAAGYGTTFGPTSDTVQYFYYGLGSNDPRAPFNRTDYVVKRVAGDVTANCSPAAGILYKTTMDTGVTTGGGFTSIPLLDCVADMQVVFGWNASGVTNSVDYYTNADASAVSGSATPAFPVNMADPGYIRQHLKVIKVYILAQDGGYDNKFINTKTNMIVGDEDLGEATLTKTINLTAANYRNYRWKLYRIVVRPKNLN